MDHIAEESSYSSANIAIVTPEMRLAVKCIGALCANQYTDLQVKGSIIIIWLLTSRDGYSALNGSILFWSIDFGA